MPRTLVVFVTTFAASTSFAAEPSSIMDNWRHWRGPAANGMAPKADPPTVWGAGKNLKWKAPLPGRGGSTPIVWGDRVFVACAIRTDRIAKANELPKPDERFETKTEAPKHFHQFLVLAFDRDTGKQLWRETAAEAVPHEGHHQTHDYAAGSPTTDGRRLYVAFGSFGTFAYSLDGKRLWARDLGRLHTRLGWGEAVTPVVHGDYLLLNRDQEADSELVCLDARTGATKWKASREERSSWNTPLIVEHGGNAKPAGNGDLRALVSSRGHAQAIVNGTNRIRSYDLATGEVLWQVGGMTVNAIPSPVASAGVAYIVSGYRGAGGVAVSLDARGDVSDDRIRWRLNRGTPYVPSPLLVGNRLYFTQANQNLLTVVDTDTGRTPLERVRLSGLKTLYASPVAASGRVYFLDRDGNALVLRQSDQLEVLATNRLEDTFNASPAAVGKQLFLRGEKFLFCLEESKKKEDPGTVVRPPGRPPLVW